MFLQLHLCIADPIKVHTYVWPWPSLSTISLSRQTCYNFPALQSLLMQTQLITSITYAVWFMYVPSRLLILKHIDIVDSLNAACLYRHISSELSGSAVWLLIGGVYSVVDINGTGWQQMKSMFIFAIGALPWSGPPFLWAFFIEELLFIQVKSSAILRSWHHSSFEDCQPAHFAEERAWCTGMVIIIQIISPCSTLD